MVEQELHLPGQHDQKEHGSWAWGITRRPSDTGSMVGGRLVKKYGTQFTQKDYNNFSKQYDGFVQAMGGKEKKNWRVARDVIKSAVGDPNYLVLTRDDGRVEGAARSRYDFKTNTTKLEALVISPWNQNNQTLSEKAMKVGKQFGRYAGPVAATLLVGLAADFIGTRSKIFYYNANEQGIFIPMHGTKLKNFMGKIGFAERPFRTNYYTFTRGAARQFVNRAMGAAGAAVRRVFS